MCTIRYMSIVQPLASTDGTAPVDRPSGRPGVGATDVQRAADTLLHEGKRPTVERIRAQLGRGSPNTIQPLLDAWWKTIGARLEAGPAALHRVPESTAHALEALWVQMLDEARRAAAVEQGAVQQGLAHQQQALEVRDQVLSLREGELQRRLAERERTAADLASQLSALSSLLRRESALREHQARQIERLEQELARSRARRSTARLPSVSAVTPRRRLKRRLARSMRPPVKESRSARTRASEPRSSQSAASKTAASRRATGLLATHRATSSGPRSRVRSSRSARGARP
jgi:hypothetical protein